MGGWWCGVEEWWSGGMVVVPRRIEKNTIPKKHQNDDP